MTATALENLTNAMVEETLAMTDEAISAEAVAELGSMEAVEAEAKRMSKVILDAFPLAH